MSDSSDPDRLSALRRQEEACTRFEAAWQAHLADPAQPCPLPDAFLADVPEPERDALRQELLRLDAAYRARAAGAPAPATQPYAGPPPSEPDDGVPEVGTVLAGRYKLLENLGIGGMGTVFVAEQIAPVRRKVAVKLIKPGMDSRQVLARFEQERQALALMDHPNIAKVLDGGVTTQGRPFFVMEYIKGEPITAYCDRARLTVRQRLELFIPVCQAVQHAHIKGIVHRDLKPSNILVALYDGVPVPKVIDFGLAKALHQPLTDLTVHTAHRDLLGTTLYMSPEQAEVNNLDVDTRADVYSLGVVLYELLTGTTPLDRERLHRAALDEVIRLIRDEEPSRPSVKLASSPARASVAALRQTEPLALSRLMSQELDWVVMKCLEKERGRRYETPTALAAHLGLYLADEPLPVHPPSLGYRLRKFARRHRGAVTAGAAVAAALLLGTVVSTSLALVARDRAQKEAAARQEESEARAEAGRRAAEAEAARQGLAKSNEELLTSVARRLLGPLAFVKVGERAGALSGPETEALQWLGQMDREQVRTRFLAEAVRDPFAARQLRTRAAHALQAAVGLDGRRRDEAERMLAAGMNSPDLAPEHRVDLALVLSVLGGLRPEVARSVAATLTQAMTRTTDDVVQGRLAEGLATVAGRLEPKEASEACRQAAATLAHAMTKSTDPYVLAALAEGLAALAGRLELKDASELCRRAAATLTHAMAKTTDGPLLRSLAEGLAAVAGRLGPKDAKDIAATLTQAMAKTTDYSPLWPLAEGLAAVVGQLEPKEAAAILTEAMLSTRLRSYDMPALAEGLAAVAGQLEPKDAKEIAATLTEGMLSTRTSRYAMPALAEGLAAVAGRLEPKEASELCRQAAAILVHEMRFTVAPEDGFQRSRLAEGLAAVAGRLEPKEASELCRQTAVTLTQAMTKTRNEFDQSLIVHAQGLAALAGRLEPREASELCRRAAAALTQAMTKTRDGQLLRFLAEGLAAVSGRLEPKEAAATLTQAMTKTTDDYALACLAARLATVSGRPELREAAGTLTQTMTKTSDGYDLRPMAEGLAAVLRRESIAHAQQRLPGLVAAVGLGASPVAPLPLPAALGPAAEPLSPPLPDPLLLDLLKHPFCVGPARRAVLDALEARHGRHFVDQWEFVRFATQANLGLDFTSPPQRPTPSAPRLDNTDLRQN